MGGSRSLLSISVKRDLIDKKEMTVQEFLDRLKAAPQVCGSFLGIPKKGP